MAAPPLHGLSREVTLAVLPRLFAEELVTELARRNISFGEYSFKQEILVGMLKDAMTQEYLKLDLEAVKYPSDNVADDGNVEFTPDAELAEREQFQCQELQKYSQALSRICPSPNIENSPSTEAAAQCHDENDAITNKESSSKDKDMCSEYADANSSCNSDMISASTIANAGSTATESGPDSTDCKTTRPVSLLDNVCLPKTELEGDRTTTDDALYSIVPGFQSRNSSFVWGIKTEEEDHMSQFHLMETRDGKERSEVTTMRDISNAVTKDQYMQADLPTTEPRLRNSEYVGANCNDEQANVCVDANGESSETDVGGNRVYIDKESDSFVDNETKNISGKNSRAKDIMMYACEECDYRAKLKQNLVRHRRIHTGEKPFKCPYCDYRAAQSANLKNHMYRHVGEKPYQCSECEYQTTQKRYLVQHMKKHTGEKPYMCGECGFRTAIKQSMDLHMKRHTGDTPHVCDVCGYRATHKSELIVHQRKHTGEKPFVCGDCGYKSAYKSALVSHMKHHTTVATSSRK